MAQYETWLKTDFDKLPQIVNIGGYTFTGDALSAKVGVIVTQGGNDVTLTGDVTGYVIRPDGVTVVVAGDKNGNRAWVELPESAFSVQGMCSLAIRITYGTDDSNKIVLGAASFNVKNTSTTTIIDPGSVVPTYDELVAQIEAIEDEIVAVNSGIDDLETQLSGVKFLTKTISANSDTWVFTFSGTCALHIITNGSIDTLRSDIWVYCTGAGAVTTTKQLATGSSSTITLTAATNKLTVTNTSSYACYAVAIVYGNPDNVAAA